jgi:hypothetical protein
MKTTIDMAREVYGAHTEWTGAPLDRLEQLVALVRADEREHGQKWFDAVTAQHKQMILAEKEACAKVADLVAREMDDTNGIATYIGKLIRNRGNI